MTAKPPVRWYHWTFWLTVLGAGLVVFYLLFTPVWVGIRLVEWFAHRRDTG